MKEQFVTFEIALKLKELGFNEPCIAYYVVTKDKFIYDINKVLNYYTGKGNFLGEKCYSAPLWQQVIDWFREKHNLYINIEPRIDKTWEYSISKLNDGLLFGSKSLYMNAGLNYHTAREQAILKTIELIKEK